MSQLKHGTDTAVLIDQYKELIQTAICECESAHKTTFNIGKLQSKLKVICKAAEYDGLNEAVINELIDQTVPKKSPKIA